MDQEQVYKIVQWHKTRENLGEHVGIFVPLPEDLAGQFPPEGKEGEDSSPPHITLLYVGDMKDPKEQKKMIDVVKKTVSALGPFEVSLGIVKEFLNEKNQRVTHSIVEGEELHKLNNILKGVFKLVGIPFSDKYPEYKPHVTIEYIEEDEEERFANTRPQGDWIVEHIWIWGADKPHMVRLG